MLENEYQDIHQEYLQQKLKKHDVHLKMHGSPLEAGDHPGKNKTNPFDADQICIYKMYM